jgi:hypothetical protein
MYLSLHFSAYDRRMHDAGRCWYIPVNLGEIPDYYRRFTDPVDIAVFRTGPMDEHGYFNFGLSNLWMRAVVERARVVIVEVTETLPHVEGPRNGVHVSEVDYIIDGGSGATFYVKESGTGNTGWVVLAGSAGSQLPAFAAQLACVGATLDPAIASSNIVFNSGKVSLTKVRIYATSFSKIILQIGAAMVGGTSPHVYVGVYKSDGTQSAAMATATVDALTPFSSSGVKTITLTNPVTVAAGDDVYIAILVTGGPSTPPSARANQAGPINGDRTATQGYRAGGSGSGLSAMPASITLSGMTTSGQMPFLGIQ